MKTFSVGSMNGVNLSAVAIVGPTASGKTATAIALCERIGGEIISVDSMQIYRDADIGTAKPTPEEQRRVRHHLIDFLPLSSPYSAADYGDSAFAAAKDILSRGKIPVFAGGTGLYLEAARTGRHETAPDTRNDALRAELLSLAETEEGKELLWQRLCAIDPETAEKAHKNNLRRVIRAIEIAEGTGIPKSEWDRRSKLTPPRIAITTLLLDFRDRELLYRRINARVDKMLKDGLVSEVERLYRSGVFDKNTTVAQAIGYKELIPYLRGECSLKDATEALKTATRRYAKRQLTWFRAVTDIRTVYMDEGGKMRNTDDVLEEILSELQICG